MTMMDCVDTGIQNVTQGRVWKAIAHMQKGNRMTLKDADKIKEAIKNSDDFVGGSDDIIKVIDSVQEVVIDTDTDTISRQQAMEEAKEWIEAVYCDHDEIRERMAIKHVINGIKELPPAQPEPHWIPVTEGLPKEFGSYQITTTHGKVAIYVFVPDSISSHEYWKRCVTAWMPLPEPYKKSEVTT